MPKLGIIVALEQESRLLRGIFPVERIWISGIGKKAYDVVKDISKTGITHLICTGTAAALSPGLRKGELIVPSHLLYYITKEKIGVDVDCHEKILTLLADTSLKTDTLLCYDQIISEPYQKYLLYKETGCIALDMESFYVLKACLEEGVKFICIKSISDTFNMKVPNWISECLDDCGAILVKNFIKKLILNPLDIAALFSLITAFFKVRNSLRYVIRRIYSSFPY